MSDQPKPTTYDITAFTHDALPEDFEPTPKPTTGEQGFHALECQHEIAEIERLNAALAAEREEARIMTNQCVQLRQELSAEREGHEMDGKLISSQEVEIQQLREQLAAARQPLVDALKEIRGLVTLRRVHQIVDAALANVKEGK